MSSLFSSNLDKFRDSNKNFEKYFDEKQVGIKEAIKIISSLNESFSV